MKISVTQVVRNGNRRFAVSWKPPGAKRVKHYFKTRREADAAADEIRDQKSSAGEAWLALTAAQRAELIAVWDEARHRRVNLREALNAFRPDRLVQKTVAAAFEEFMAAKRQARLSRRRLSALKSVVGRFAANCAGKELTDVTTTDVSGWLGNPHPSTFNTYLRALNAFFNWCQRMKYLKESPAAAVAYIDERRLETVDDAPPILSLEQCRRLLMVCRDIDDGLIPYVACCLFAGIRPEREAKLEWIDVGEEILIRGKSAKTRQRRYVPIHPVLAAWLGRPSPVAFGPVAEKYPVAVQLGPAAGTLPPVNLRRRFEAVRRRAELFENWQQDCMRHTFASMSLVQFGPEKTIAALGHGDYEMLFRHYRALVKPDVAAKFWNLMP